MIKKTESYSPDLISRFFCPDKITHTKSKVIIAQKVCKTKIVTKKQKIAQNSEKIFQKRRQNV